MHNEIDRAREALFAIPSDCNREEWVKLGMAAKAAGLGFEDFHDWSSGAANYESECDVATTWRSFKAEGGVTAKTLFKAAIERGYRPNSDLENTKKYATKTRESPAKRRNVLSAGAMYGRAAKSRPPSMRTS